MREGLLIDLEKDVIVWEAGENVLFCILRVKNKRSLFSVELCVEKSKSPGRVGERIGTVPLVAQRKGERV